jgi:ATP-dependent helicase/nuclease subunit B
VSGLPSLSTIPAGRPFVADLASGLLARFGDDPLALSDVTVLLPHRRAARALRDSFLRLTEGRGLLLPRMRPIGDVDEQEMAFAEDGLAGPDLLAIPPALEDTARTALLARMVAARGDIDLSTAGCWRMGKELGRLIDQVHIEGLSFDALEAIVPDELAGHWQAVLRFLSLARQAWPAILAERGTIDAADRRDRLIRALAARWRAAPPDGPVIAAGSTGSVPATADLLATVADLPQGAVVLPGLDRALDEASWRALDPGHPQFGMAQLLAAMDRARDEVADWPGRVEATRSGSGTGAPRPDRSVLLREAFRPAATTPAWQNIKGLDHGALAGLTRIEAETRREEAEAIALMFREVLEEPGKTARLVTPDRVLARRVAAALGRWGIAVDDSAGRPLSDWEAGGFLRLIAQAAADRASPVAWLALMKHPLTQAGQPRAEHLAAARAIDRTALRGLRPPPGLDALIRRVGQHCPAAQPALARIADLCRPFFDLVDGPPQPPGELLEAHMRLAEALAERPGEPGALVLWRGEAGEAAATLVARLRTALADLPAMAAADYAALIDTVLGEVMVRPRGEAHPRLSILGPLEARLDEADLTVLGSLNEGTWPADNQIDPWMSRQMRKDFGLPALERRVGLAAHDVAQMMAAPEVVMTRARRVDGAPAVASRWWLRLDAVLHAAGLPEAKVRSPIVAALALDRAEGPVRPAPEPAPRPPASARPDKISVTDVGLWMVDPYAFYAKRVLRLRPLDPLEEEPGPAQRGEIVHAAIEGLTVETAHGWPDDRSQAAARLLAHGERAFARLDDYPGLKALWWPRFCRLAEAFVAAEQAHRATAAPLGVECKGHAELTGVFGTLTLIARADRIDRALNDRGGGLIVIDYKTGRTPSDAMVAAGITPQLPLEAVIARRGGFTDKAGQAVAEAVPTAGLAYWHLDGKGEVTIRAVPSERAVRKGEAPPLDQLIDEAEEGLIRLATKFADPATPYGAQLRGTVPAGEPYAHLARAGEWSRG